MFSAGISVHVKSSEHSLQKKANVCHVMVLSQTVHIGLLSYLTCKCIYLRGEMESKIGTVWSFQVSQCLQNKPKYTFIHIVIHMCNIVYISCPLVSLRTASSCCGPQSQNYDLFVYPSSVRDVKCTSLLTRFTQIDRERTIKLSKIGVPVHVCSSIDHK